MGNSTERDQRSRRRRLLAVAAVIGITAASAPLVGETAARADAPTTIPAPNAGESASIVVSRTTGLANQSVDVSWSGFRPSSRPRLNNADGNIDISTTNPVRVYQCRGTAPTSSSECYGAPGFAGIPNTPGVPGYAPVSGFTYAGQTDPYFVEPDGPANFQDTATAADGTGSVKIQIFTVREAPSLGCKATSPCSLVVVPNYGRPQGATSDLFDAPWSWARRTVIPITFAETLESCPFADDQLMVEGSPAAARLFASWRAGTCSAEPSVAVDYTAIGEPQARNDTAAGIPDVGLVTLPVPGVEEKITHAPIGLTGVVFAFQIDDENGRPVTEMKLNARLVAKIFTASYRTADNPNVAGNPVNLFSDPEFRELNPDTRWPLGAPGNRPILLADLSDLTYTVTRWIDADPEARAFLDGEPDPYGMKVNAAYRGIDLPVFKFPSLDRFQTMQFEPIVGLDLVARQLSLAKFPGAHVEYLDGLPIITRPPRQSPGRREIIGIVDAAQAAEFLLPTASLQNHAGKYVAPSIASFVATTRHMTKGVDDVREVDVASNADDVYPWTVALHAAIPVEAPAAQAQAIGNFLDYVVGPGQEPGAGLGQLPEGYAPLPKAFLDDIARARAEMLNGREPEPTTTTTTTPTTVPTTVTTMPSTSFDSGFTSGQDDTGGETGSSDGTGASERPTDEPDDENETAAPRATIAAESALGLIRTSVPVLAAAGTSALLCGPFLLRKRSLRLKLRRQG